MNQDVFLNCLLASTAAGIFCAQIFSPSSLIVLASVAITFLLAAASIHFRSKLSAAIFIALFCALGMLRFQAVDRLPEDDISNFADQQLTIVGSIINAPDFELIDHQQYLARFDVEIQSIKTKDGLRNASGRVRMSARLDEPPRARIGDRITAYGKLRLPINYNNPGQIDTTMLLRTDGITARMSISKARPIIDAIDDVSLPTTFFRTMADVRRHYRELLDDSMNAADSAAIFAMLFGGYGGLRKELIDSFTTVGLVHILSVSGSHISILAAAAGALAAIFRLRRLPKFMIGSTIIFAYAVLSGCVPPVIRAAATGALTFFALAFGYQREARRLLTIVALIMLIVNPLLLFHISFQLSMTATAGILYLSPTINRALARLNPHDAKFRTAIFTSIACTLGATIMPQPVVAWYFNQLSISALLANLIVAPILEFIIVVGLAAGLIAFVLPPLAKIICVGLSLAFGAAYELTALLARLPASSVYFPTLQPIAAAAYWTLIAALLHFENDRRRIIRYSLVAILVALAFAAFEQKNVCTVHFIDVHQGDCALVITPAHHAMLFDTGGVREHSFDIGARVVVPYLKHFGVTRIDYIFLTHAHEDHCEAVGSILEKIPVDHIITSNDPKADYANSFGMSIDDPALESMRPAVDGENFSIDGASVDVVYAPDYSGGSTGNETSNVYRLSYGRASFLFTGDLVVEGEQKILDRSLRSTVLKVGHHGSNTSSSEEFLRAVAPMYAVICVGANNTFGHPRREIVERLEAVGASIKRTDVDGAVVFSTDGTQMRVSTYR